MMAWLRWIVPLLMLWGATACDLASGSAGSRVPVVLPPVIMALVVSQPPAAAVAWSGLGGLLLDCGSSGGVGTNMALTATVAWGLHALLPGIRRRSLLAQAAVSAVLWMAYRSASLSLFGTLRWPPQGAELIPSAGEWAMGLAAILASLLVSRALGSEDVHAAPGELAH